MKSILLITALMIGLTTSLFAQDFEIKEHSFGVIQEDEGQVSTTFEFTNNENAPLIINSVKPSCGCTAADYTKEPILPGQKGYIKANYNPKNRPGPFNKSIAVKFSNEKNIVLAIKGNVIGSNTIQRPE